jgi:UDP-2,4-diacetamido-2,4,6-trideoxy-beta-L-altropyranose hydrolase
MPRERVPSILFAPDSGAEIGGGHVMRCLTLARVLARRGWRVAFVAGPAGKRLIETFGWPGIETADDLAAAAEVVVLDNYRLGEAAEAPLRALGRRVAVIDDLADRRHACDLLADPSFGRHAADYAGLAPGARVLAGPAYALLRPGFAAARPEALARRDGRRVERVLVSLGLTDLGGITGRVVRALGRVFDEASTDVVVGAQAPSLPDLQRLQDGRAIQLHVDTADMEALMSRADVAIGAGGSSTWERACLGLPSVSLILADNQRAMTCAFDSQGLALAVDAQAANFAAALQQACRRLGEDAGLRRELARRSAELCDGMGAERVADAVEALAQTPSSGSAGS